MSMGLEKIRESMCAFLKGHGLATVVAWPRREREPLEGAVVCVSLRQCQAGPSGYRDYLGERWNEETREWEELYGRKSRLTFGLDLYAEALDGEGVIQEAFDRLMEAFQEGGPAGMKLAELSCGETGYDPSGRLLCRKVEAVCSAYLYAVTQPGGAFLDFEIRGEVKV